LAGVGAGIENKTMAQPMKQPILMTEEYWANSQFSVVRHTGRVKWNGVTYIICNKEGKDIFQCSIEAEKEGRDKAIEPGEPCDLIDERYLPVYRKLGREKFIELIKKHQDLTPEMAFELCAELKLVK
jgi:hypothetical protein